MIGIKEFSDVDMRVGRIISVDEHEGAMKPMYKLKVDLGPEIGERSIVAGIKDIYSKEELIGRLVICVANLEPKMIAGAESNGMVLAAEDENGISLLTPDKNISPGARIH